MKKRCIWCDGDCDQGKTVFELFFSSDLLCGKCRRALIQNKQKIKLNQFKVEALYEYNEAFSEMLIQYKECYDEALKDVFLYPYNRMIKWKYRGYTMIPMPSSKEKENIRGFKHVSQMFEKSGLKVMDVLYREDNIEQKHLSKKDRDTITIYRKEGKVPYKVLLVDDVMTTGSTLKAALKCFEHEKHKIKICVVALHKKRKIFPSK